MVLSYGEKAGWKHGWGESWGRVFTDAQLAVHIMASVLLLAAYILGEGIVQVRHSQYNALSEMLRLVKKDTADDGADGTSVREKKGQGGAAKGASSADALKVNSRHTNHSFSFLSPQVQTTMPAAVLDMSPFRLPETAEQQRSLYLQLLFQAKFWSLMVYLACASAALFWHHFIFFPQVGLSGSRLQCGCQPVKAQQHSFNRRCRAC